MATFEYPSFGGPSNFPSTTVGYLGDFVVYFVEASDVTLTFTQTNEAQLCSECGEPIPTAGVKANPQTTLCVDCKSSREREPKAEPSREPREKDAVHLAVREKLG